MNCYTAVSIQLVHFSTKAFCDKTKNLWLREQLNNNLSSDDYKHQGCGEPFSANDSNKSFDLSKEQHDVSKKSLMG